MVRIHDPLAEEEIPFQENSGKVSFEVGKFDVHRMVVVEFE